MDMRLEMKMKQKEADGDAGKEAKPGTGPGGISLKQHTGVVHRAMPLLDSVPTDEVRSPDMPIDIFIAESTTMVLAAQEHAHDLEAVGYTQDMAKHFESLVLALDSAQAVWSSERKKGRTEETARIMDEAVRFRSWVMDAAALAFRKNSEGRARLSMIRENEGMPDVIADLRDLAIMLTDFPESFEAIRVNVEKNVRASSELGAKLQVQLAQERVNGTISNSKELRDRAYTLAREGVSELRAYASFAFRDDATDSRRGRFLSSYHRTRGKRQRQNARASRVELQSE